MDQLNREIKKMSITDPNYQDNINQLWRHAIDLLHHSKHKLKNVLRHFTAALYAKTKYDKINHLLLCHECDCNECVGLIIDYSSRLSMQFCINHMKQLLKYNDATSKSCFNLMTKIVYIHSRVY